VKRRGAPAAAMRRGLGFSALPFILKWRLSDEKCSTRNADPKEAVYKSRDVMADG
jgi:hypothetical protein